MTEENVVAKAPVDPFVSTFKVDGKFYDVPDTDVEVFKANMPKAEKIFSFKQGESTYDVPETDAPTFLNNMPNAKPEKNYDFSQLYKSENPAVLTPQVTSKGEKPVKPESELEPSFSEHPLDWMGSFVKNAGNAFVSSGRTALAETGLAVEDQALKINNALKSITPNSWGGYFDKDNAEINENITSLHRFKDNSEKLTGKPGETLGSILPFVGMAAATMLTKSPQVAAATAEIFGEMGYGSGIETYDDFINKAQGKDPSIKTDESTRTFAGLGYMAAMSIPMGSYIGKMMPKGVFKGALDGILKDTPEVATKLGSEIFENYAKNNPGAAKQLLATVAKGMGHGIVSMEAMELTKKAVDEALIGKKDGPGWLETMGNAVGSGILFGGLTAPFSMIAQNSATRQRWDKQGAVTISHDEKGNPFEIFTDKDGSNKGMTPDGKVVDITQDQIKNSFTIPTNQFVDALNAFSKTGEVSPTMERDAYSGRVKQMTDRISDKDGNIYVSTDANGNPFYNIGGNKMVDSNGTQGEIDPSLQWKRVNKGEVWQGLMSKFDQFNEGKQSSQPQNGSRPELQSVDPRTQTEQQAREFHQTYTNKETGILKTIYQVTPDGEQNLPWNVTSEWNEPSPDGKSERHMYLAQTSDGQYRQFEAGEVVDNNDGLAEDDFAAQQLGAYDQNEQNKQLIDQSRIIYNGQHYILSDQNANGDYDAVGDNNQVITIPGSVIDKIQGSLSNKPEIVTRTYGKTQVSGTRDQQGNILLSDPMGIDQVDALNNEVEKSTGGKAQVSSKPIPGTDSTLPDQYEVVISPITEKTGTQGQEATIQGTSPVVPAEKKVVTQTIGKTDIDFTEDNGSFEVVPSEKVTLDNALPALEKKFKDHPKFKLQVEKAQIEIPGKVIKGETIFDDDIVEPSTKQTVIKSIKLVPKPAPGSNVAPKLSEGEFYQWMAENHKDPVLRQEAISALQRNGGSDKLAQQFKYYLLDERNGVDYLSRNKVSENVNNTETESVKVPEIPAQEVQQEPIEEIPTAESEQKLQELQNNEKESLQNEDSQIAEIEKRRAEEFKNQTVIPEWRLKENKFEEDLASAKANVEWAKQPGNSGYLKSHEDEVAYHEKNIAEINRINEKYDAELKSLNPNEELTPQQEATPILPRSGEIRKDAPQEEQGQIESKGQEENVIGTAIIEQQPNLNPTESQKEAGNYKKAHVKIQGMDISIENPIGSVRRGKDEDGKAWEHTMKSHYGYFKNTVGKDRDHIDTFVGPNPESAKVFVIDQINPKTGAFDESKVMLGYNDVESARQGYLENYDKNWKGLSAITEVEVEPFKKWLLDGSRQLKPFNEYKETPAPILSEDQTKTTHNSLISLVEKYNKTAINAKARPKMQLQILQTAQKLGYKVETDNQRNISILKDGKKIKRFAQKQTSEEINDHPLLDEYPPEVQDFFHRLNASNSIEYLDIPALIPQGVRDILAGKKSVAANTVLDEISGMLTDNVVKLRGTQNSKAINVPIEEYFATFDRPLEDDQIDFVDKISDEENEANMAIAGFAKLTPEEQNEFDKIFGDENIDQVPETTPDESGDELSGTPQAEGEVRPERPAGTGLFDEVGIDQETPEEKRIAEKLSLLNPKQKKEAEKLIKNVDVKIKAQLSAIRVAKKALNVARNQAREERQKAPTAGQIFNEGMVDSHPVVQKINTELTYLQKEYFKLLENKEALVDKAIAVAIENVVEQGNMFGAPEEYEPEFKTSNHTVLVYSNGVITLDKAKESINQALASLTSGRGMNQSFEDYMAQNPDVKKRNDELEEIKAFLATDPTPEQAKAVVVDKSKPLTEVLKQGVDHVEKKKESTEVGTNSDGNKLFVDGNGNRFYLSGNIKVQAPVAIIPGRGFVVDTPEQLFKNRQTQFLTPKEIEQFAPRSEDAYLPGGWRGNLIKSRIAATNIFTTDELNRFRDSGLIDWSDASTIENVIDQRLGTSKPKEIKQDEPIHEEVKPLDPKQARLKELAEKMRKLLPPSDQVSEPAAEYGNFNSEILSVGSEMAMLHVQTGKTSFADFSKAMVGDLGPSIKPYLKSIYNGARDLPGMEEYEAGMTDYNEVKKADIEQVLKENTTKAVDKSPKNNLPLGNKRAFIEELKLKIGQEKLNIVSIRKIASNHGLTDIKDTTLQEYVELVLIEKAKQIISSNLPASENYAKIVELYNNQPTISMRSSERIEKQQYSTPLPMSFMAGEFVNAINPKSLLEPSAGNGMMVFNVDPKIVIANEIDQVRLDNLREQGFNQVTNQDGTTEFDIPKVDAVVTNPPFGRSDARDYKGYKISGLDEQMVVNALENLSENGRASIIIGGHTKYKSNGTLAGEKAFFNYLYNFYNVSDVINMDGGLYSKQGTSYPTRLILINGTRTANTRVYAPLEKNTNTDIVTTFDELQQRVNKATNGKNILQPEIPVRNNNVAGSRSGNGRTPSAEGTGTLDFFGTSTGSNQPGSGQAGNAGPANRPERTPSPNDGNRRDSDTPERNQGNDDLGAGGNDRGIRPEDTSKLLNRPDELAGDKVDIDLSNEKTPYPARSKSAQIGSVVPTNVAQTLADVLSVFKDIDEYTQIKLGYNSKDELYSALAAEQVDSVALAIYQIENGGALIIGDMTGVGKGRQAAAILRYAHLQGKKPIFVTEKAHLFSDIYRDLRDIGSADLKPFIFNSKSQNSDPTIVDENGTVVYAPLSEAMKRPIFQGGKIPSKYDYAVLTYSQLNAGVNKQSVKKEFFSSVLEDNILVLDESHNAGGEGNTGTFMTESIPRAKGVVFLSGTFAKRADNMPIYALKTSMSDANMSNTELIEAIKTGGVPLQEIMSKNLTQSGQMIRRERDFTGVNIDWKTIEDADTHFKAYDSIIKVFNDLIQFQREHIDPIIEEKNEELAAMQAGAEHTAGTTDFGINNVPFASKTFNLTRQLLFSLKAKNIADEAISELKAGRRPVIAVANTMEGFMNELGGIGEKISNFDFSTTLMKGLYGLFRFTETDGMGEHQNLILTVNDLPKEARDRYYEIEDFIKNMSVGISISPIDVIKADITKAGYTVGEMTGRTNELTFNPDGTAQIQKRTNTDKKKITRDFQSGKLDALIINQSASTGISLHASEKVSDQRQRIMLSAQTQLDVNTEVQMRGRIDRTGQIVRGAYRYILSPIPAEQRMTMMFKVKLKSLDANTTSSQKSKTNEIEIVDFLNKYGDKICVDHLKEDSELNEKLLDPMKLADKSEAEIETFIAPEGAALKIAGRVALLPINEQQKFYDEITEKYNTLLNYLNDTNSNDLEITTLPLRAETKEKVVIVQGKGGDNPFAQDSYREKVEIDVLKKPLKAEEIKKEIEKHTGGLEQREYRDQLIEKLDKYAENLIQSEIKKSNDDYNAKEQDRITKANKIFYKQNVTDAEELKQLLENYLNTSQNIHNASLEKRVATIKRKTDGIRGVFNMFPVGNVIMVPNTSDISTNTSYSEGVLMGYKMGEKLNPSTITAIFATLDSRRKIEVPLSKIDFLNASYANTIQLRHSINTTLDNWDEKIPTRNRRTGYIITGNILQAFAGNEGQLIAYTDIDGNIKEGILLHENYKPNEQQMRVQIIKKIDEIRNGQPFTDVSGNVRIGKQHSGGYAIDVPLSKQSGGMYFLDPGLRDLVIGRDFRQMGNRMVGAISESNLENVLQYMSDKHNTSVNIAITQSSRPTQETPVETPRAAVLPASPVRSVPLTDFLNTAKGQVVNKEVKPETPIAVSAGSKLLPVEEFKHTKTGQILYNVKINGRSDEYTHMLTVAKRNNPYGKTPYSTFAHGFLFEKKEDAIKFKNQIDGDGQVNESQKPYGKSLPLTEYLKQAKENKIGNSDLSLLEDNQLSLDFSDAKEYQTEKGETIRYKNSAGTGSYPSGSNLRRSASKNEIVYTGLERQLNEIGHIQLSGDTKIESPDDVAYLFRSLESAPTENVFTVLHQKDGGFKVLYLSTGGTTSSIVDIKLITAAVGEFNAESVTLVHNHPSGNLEPSDADRRIVIELQKALTDIAELNSSVIINLDSGKYAVLHNGVYDSQVEQRPKEARIAEEPAKTYQFNKSILYDNSDNIQQIKGSRNVAEFLSKMKRGTSKKFTVLILSRSNKITRAFLTDDISPRNIVPMVGKHGESVIISTNANLSVPRALEQQLKSNGTQLLDWIQVQQDTDILANYKSFGDEGLLEPRVDYGIREVNDPDRAKPLTQLLKEAKEATKYIPGVTEGKEFIEKFTTSFRNTLIPASIEKNKPAAEVMRSALGTMSRRMDLATAALKTAKRRFDLMSKEQSLDFIDNMERGLKQPTVELQGFSDALRQMLDTTRKNVQDLGTGKLEQFIENYFPHFWEKKGRISEKFSNKTRNPLEGTKGFLKQRTIEFVKDGVEAGLTPITYNPVKLTLMKIREMERYIMAHRTLNELKHTGYIRFVKFNRPAPLGFTMIDDKVSRVMIPQDNGMLHVGNWYAEDGTASIINNFLSKGLWGYQVYDLYRGLGNMLTQFQLSLSAFHLGFTSFDATISKFANAMEYLYHGHAVEGVKSLALAPTAAITNIVQGSKLRHAWNGESAHAIWSGKNGSSFMTKVFGNPNTTEMKEIADFMEQAGGRAKMDDFYREGWYDRIIDNLKKHRYLSAAAEVPLLVVEQAARPILEFIVPRQKLGVFMDMVQYELKVNPTDDPIERRKRMQYAWDSVDNRMGQLVYDNLFWHHVTKDVLMAMVRSVGWNLGTIREVGGAPNELKDALWDAVHGKTSKDTHKIAYSIGLIAVTMIASAIYMFLRTGKRPDEPKDYFFPKDGGTDKNGDPTRGSLPTYVKDLYHYGNNFPHGLFKTAIDKLNPVNGVVAQMMSNKDYYGTKIWNEDDKISDKTIEVLTYMKEQFKPFGIRNVEKSESTKMADKVLPFIGIIPAPYDLNMTDTEKLMSDIMREKLPVGGRTKEQAESSKMRAKLRNGYQKNGDITPLREALRAKDITFDQFKDITKDSRMDPLQRSAQRLTDVELAYVFTQADEKSKRAIAPILQKKVINRLKTQLTKDERSGLDYLMTQIKPYTHK